MTGNVRSSDVKIRCTALPAHVHVFPCGGREGPFALRRTLSAKARGTYGLWGGAVSMGWNVGRWPNKKAGRSRFDPTGNSTLLNCTFNCAPAPLRPCAPAPLRPCAPAFGGQLHSKGATRFHRIECRDENECSCTDREFREGRQRFKWAGRTPAICHCCEHACASVTSPACRVFIPSRAEGRERLLVVRVDELAGCGLTGWRVAGWRVAGWRVGGLTG